MLWKGELVPDVGTLKGRRDDIRAHAVLHDQKDLSKITDQKNGNAAEWNV